MKEKKNLFIILIAFIVLLLVLSVFWFMFSNNNTEQKRNIISIHDLDSNVYYKDLTIKNILLEKNENDTVFSLDVINETTNDVDITAFDIDLLTKDKDRIGKLSCYFINGIKSNEKLGCYTKVETQFKDVYYFRFVDHDDSGDFEIKEINPEEAVNSDGSMSNEDVSEMELDKNKEE